MRHLPRLSVIALCTGLATPAVAAPEAGDGDGAIIVTALPAPPSDDAYGSDEISGDRLQMTASGNLEEALARIPGFQQFRRSDGRSANLSGQGITLRGIGGNATSRTLLLRDGVPIADAFFGYIPFTALPLADLASVDVTRGSGAGPFGAGALAGVISLHSTPLSARAPLVAEVAGGSNASWRGRGAITLPLGAGHVGIDISHLQSDGFWTTPVAQRVAASVPAAHRASALSLTGEAPISDDVTMQARVSLFRDARTLRFAGADNGGDGADFSLRLVGNALDAQNWQWDVLGWVQARDFSSIVVSAATFRPTLDQFATPTIGWGTRVELRAPTFGSAKLPIRIRFGAEYRGADGEALENALAASGAVTRRRRAGGGSATAGIWAEADVESGPLTLTLGTRYDHYWLTDGHFTETLGDGTPLSQQDFAGRQGDILGARGAASYHLGSGFTLRAAAYTGFRLPTLNELYRGFTVFPVVTRANAALAPERLRGGEVALDWRRGDDAAIAITLFDNRLRHAVANVTIGPNLRERQNVDAVRARGVEGSMMLRLGTFRIDAGVSYSDARVVASGAAAALNGLQPAQSPLWSGGATLNWQTPWQGVVQIALRHVGAQFEDDRNVDVLPAYTAFDLMLRQPITARLTAEASIENMTNVRILTRNVAGSVDLGAPRSIWLGLRWQGF